MATPALAVVVGGLGDQECRLHRVAQPDQPVRQPAGPVEVVYLLLQVTEVPEGAREPPLGADQPHVVPHRVLDGPQIAPDEGRVRFLHSGLLPGRHLLRGDDGEHAPRGDVPRRALAPDQPLQQRRGGQPVGPVHSGTGHLSHGVEIPDRRPAPLVGPDPAAEVVGRGDDRDGLGGDVQSQRPAPFVDGGEALPNPRRREDGGNVQQHIGVPVHHHFVVDGPRDHVPGGQVAPIGSVLPHKRAAVGGEQPSPFPPYRLGDEEPLRSGEGQDGGVKLDVLGVDDPRAGPVGHGQPVAPGAFGVGGVAVDAPQPARRQYRCSGEVPVHPSRGPVQHVRAVAGDGVVDGEGVAGVVGEGDEVHRRGVGHQADVGGFPQRGDQRPDDGLPRRVADMEDAGAGVGPLQAVGQVPVGLPVKGDVQFPNQQLLHQPGPLLRQDADGGGEAQAGPGGQHVLDQQIGAVVLSQGHDPPLRVAGVALLGVGRAGDQCHLSLAVARQEQRRRRPGNAATNDQDVGLYWFVRHFTPIRFPSRLTFPLTGRTGFLRDQPCLDQQFGVVN